MPVISFASIKGGAGKTTACLILAGEIAHEGLSVEIIDADPRRPIAAWARKPGKPDAIRVTENRDGRKSIIEEIDRALARADWVLVDLEGAASSLMDMAVLRSNLVLIPAQEQFQDAEAAMETVAEVRRVGQGARTEIPHAIVVTRAKAAVRGSVTRWVAAQIASSGVRALDHPIVEREAYGALYALGGTVRGLTEIRAEKAIANAAEFADDVAALLGELAEAV